MSRHAGWLGVLAAAALPWGMTTDLLAQPQDAGLGALRLRVGFPVPPGCPVPLHADLPEPLPTETVRLVPTTPAGGPARLGQRDPELHSRLWWVEPAPAPGTDAPAVLRLEPVDHAPPALTVHLGEHTLLLRAGDASVLEYHHAVLPPPEGKNPLYARSAFIHPLRSPAGEVLTAIHAPDHLHHMGIWNPWTSTVFEGRKVDFWNLAKGEGTVRFVEYGAAASGPVFGAFRAIQDHLDLKAPGGPKAAIREHFDVRVWNWQGGDRPAFLIDVVSTQRCASESPITLEAYRYGGLGFRAREEWANGDHLTSEGRTRKDGHGTRARWCHAFGPTGQGEAGVLFMSHPGNRDHPEPMRIWPQGHIFFNFCPIQKTPWTFEPGRDYTLRYRLYVYDGKPSAEFAEVLWQAFAAEPQVTVTAAEK